jgi:tRNA(Ile)-lysidine synthase
VSLVRPLLDASRAEVIDYLSSLDQPFCQDATNDDWQFTRNRIRHELLPLLARDYSPGVVAALVRLGALARDAQDVLEAVGEASLDRSLVESDAARLVLDCRALDAEHRHVVREMLIAAWRRQAWPLQAMGSAEWNLLADMALSVQSPDTANIRKQVLPGAITAERRGERLVLQKNAIVSPH